MFLTGIFGKRARMVPVATKFKTSIIKEGQTTREVKSWDEYHGIKFPIRQMAVARQTYSGEEWDENLEEEYISAKEGLESLLSLKDTGRAQTKERREKEIAEVEATIKDLEERRKQKTEWENLQIWRCIHGHGSLTGFHYFLYNFGYYQKIENQVQINFQPDYRSCDAWVTRLLETARTNKTGLCLVKRRRWGWSWLLTAYIIYNILFMDGNVFFVTKDEDDRRKFFERIRFFHDSLPPFLQKEYASDALEFKSWKPSMRIAQVRDVDFDQLPLAMLRTGSPKNEANVEGGTCTMFVIDEAGKMPNLRKILKVGIPMLAGSNGLFREGMLIIGGTVGDMTLSGRTLKKVFYAPKAYEIMPVFVKGTMGTFFDRFGNDDEEKAMEFIMDKLQAFNDAGLIEEAINWRQMYPLTLKDAFRVNTQAKLWPVHHIQAAEDIYEHFRPNVKYGRFIRDRSNNQVVFKQEEPAGSNDPNYDDHIGYNQVHMYEDVRPELKNWHIPYVQGVDPVSLDRDTYKEVDAASRYMDSDYAFCIYKRGEHVGGKSNWPVCWYYGRHDNLDFCYEQSALASEYYLRAKINIERQKGDRMKKWLETADNGIYADLVAYGSGVAKGFDKTEATWGFHMSERMWGHLLESGLTWWNKHGDAPVPKRFIDESFDIKERNTDIAVAFLSALMLSEEYDLREANGMPRTTDAEKTVNKALWVEQNGILVPAKSTEAIHPLLRGTSASARLYEQINEAYK